MRIPRTQLTFSSLLCGWLLMLAGCGTQQQNQTFEQFVVTATPATVSVGGSVQVQAVLNLSGGISQDVTSSTQWTLSNPKIATLSNGKLTTKAAGTLNIQGAYIEPASSSNTTAQTVTSTAQVTVKAAAPADPATPSIVWNPPAAIQYGTPLSETQLNATTDVSGTFAYTPAAGTILSAGVRTLSVTFTPSDPTAYTTAKASVPLTVTQATPVITWPQPASVPSGTVLGPSQLNATASVAGTFVYTPAAGTALQAGTEQLTASFTPADTTDYVSTTTRNSIVVAAKPASITLKAIQVAASATTVAVGGTLQLTATGTYSDSSTKDLTDQVNWQSSNTSVATAGGGTVTGVSSGTTQIAASLNGVISAPISIRVSPAAITLTSVQISAAATSVSVGATLQFKAIGTYSDKSTKDITGTATWQSSNSSLATVSDGTVTGVAAGTAQVTASSNGIYSTAVGVTIKPAAPTLTAIQILGSGSSVSVGSTLQFTATGSYSDHSTKDLTSSVTWLSSNPSDATISGGLLTGVAAGTAAITAKSGKLTSPSVRITINPATVTLTSIQISAAANSVFVGGTLQLRATGRYSDNSTQDLTGTATWRSSNVSYASVSGGLVTGMAKGTAGITASSNGVTSSPVNITVSAATATLTSIQISPAASSVFIGATLQFRAIGTYSDNSTKDLTSIATWQSSNSSLATVSDGTVRGLAKGTAMITASSSGTTSAPASVTVSPVTVTLTAIQISAASSSLAVGATLQLTAIATYSDQSTKDITGTAVWQSSNSFATVSGGLVSGITAGTATITASSNGVTSAPVSLTINPATPTLTSIQISASASSVNVGSTLQFRATGTYSDNSTKDLTSTAAWQSSNSGFATVSGGLVTGVAAGTVQITANSNGVTSAPASLTVNPSSATLTSIQISASASSINVGSTLQFTATGTYSDKTTKDLTSTASWQSSNSGFATVSGGLVTGVAAGTAQITASSNGVTSAPASLTVNPSSATLTSIQISASASSVNVGATLQFTATGTYSDKTTKDLTSTASWQSSNSGFATVSGGLVTGVAAGSVQITASSNGMTSAPASLTVNPSSATLTSIQISASASSLNVGATLQFTATGTYSDKSTKDLTSTASWQSSNSGFATVSGGLVTGVAAGTVQITASSNGVTSAPASLTVNPSSATLTSIQISASASSVNVGATLQFTATGTYSDKTTKNLTSTASWQSSNSGFATVTGGLVTGIAAGSVQITASSNGVTSAPVSLTVNPSSATLTSIQISASASSVNVGATLQFTATGTYSDKTTKDLTSTASWQSSNSGFATVSGGLVTGVAAGTVQITASSNGVTSAPSSLTISAPSPTLTSIQISASASSVNVGGTLQFTATGTYSDKSTKNLTSTASWQSSNSGFATVSGGLVTGVAAGTAQITASSNGVTSAPSSLTISAPSPTLTSIQISASASSVNVGATLQFTATGTYSDKSTKNLTSTASWQSSNSGFATVSGGLVTGVAAGTVQITASSNGVTSAPSSLTVGSATLTGITISPASPAVAIGSTTQLSASATYSDGSTSSITGNITWSSADPRTVGVSSSGLATGLATGNIVVTASYQGQSASVTVASSIGTVQWSGPITITAGGTYSGNWKSTSANTPAVTVKTTAAVLIQNSHVTGPGNLIATATNGVNLTVKNVIGLALNSNVSGQADGDFVYAQKPASLDVENCYMENVDYGIWVLGYTGNYSTSQTITLLSNRARNMTGLESNGSGGYINGDTSSAWSHFIQLSNINALPGIQIAWNEVVNYPNQSLATAEIINMYDSGGTSASPALIHDNYIQGAYPYNPATDSFSGGGIITDGTSSDTVATASAYNDIYNNQVVSTTNQGIELGAGHDNSAYNNEVVSSGLLPDGTKIAGQNVGITIYDGYGNIARGTMYNNSMSGNTVGWMCWVSGDAPRYRNDFYFPNNNSDYTSNTSISANPITLAMEAAEYTTWQSKTASSQINVGPIVSSGGSSTPAAVQKLAVPSLRSSSLMPAAAGQSAISAGTETSTGSGASGAGVSGSGASNAVVLESVAILPAQPTVAIGSTTQLKAIAAFSDGSTKDVTTSFGWSSSDLRTVAITASGLASGLASGSAVLSGSYQGQPAQVTVLSSIGDLAWSGPIVITRGGVYSGNWQSQDPKTPAVTLATTQPVTIENSHIRSASALISAHLQGSDLTVRNTVGIATNPNLMGQPNGIFLDSISPAHLDVENCYVENVISGVRVHGYAGLRDGRQTIVIRANRARNMNGSLSDGRGGYLPGEGANRRASHFLQLDSLQAVPGIDLGWNEVINYPRHSLASDGFDLFRASGTPNSPIELHDSYIQGAYPFRPALDSFDGGGITIDGSPNDTPQNASAFNDIHDNQIVATVHYGIHFAAGHDNLATNNRILASGLLPNGSPIAAQFVGASTTDPYGNTANGSMFNNSMRDNLIGWNCWSQACSASGFRNDQLFPFSPADYSSNTLVPTKSISPQLENNEYSLWLNKLSSSAITIGPSF